VNVHRVSGYKRVERDAYQTIEPWVTDALLSRFRLPRLIWEPACGDGHMARALLDLRHDVMSTDIHGEEGRDFLAERRPPWETRFAIVTNPPFGPRGKTAEAFIWKALELTKVHNGSVAMLLPSDFDHAVTRAGLFRSANYAMRIVLTARPKWFDGGATPKTNFVWHVWDHLNIHAPTVAYAGRE
jgi:hypothetical protein